ncbi:MAG: hypothetical protein A4E73_01572 [Syntrophaceae bacterium PtaU1.Bin231]|nr:MAG: hypothetical protein A4E73_01572 [Syntrophaceae bacterium PtaU1.Bin231]
MIVLQQHAVRVVFRTEGLHRPLDHAHPFLRDPRDLAVVVHGDHRVFQQGVQRQSVLFVRPRDFLRVIAHDRSDDPAVPAVIPFAPPSVGYTHVEDAVDDDLLPAGAAGLVRSPRRVQPDVDALDKPPGDPDVVVLDEEDLPPEAVLAADVDHLLQDALAHLVVGVGFAREDDVDRVRLVVHDPVQAVRVGKEHVGPLVRGEAPGESDPHGRRIDLGKQLFAPGLRITVFLPVAGDVFDDEVDGALLDLVAGAPEERIGDVLDPRPAVRVGDVLRPVHPQEVVQHLPHARGEVGHVMRPVGDVLDRDVRFVEPLPDVAPHAARHLAVDAAHGVAHVTHLQGEDGHEEGLVLAGLLEPEFPELGPGDAGAFDEVAEIMLDQFPGEPFVAGLDGRVGREDGSGADGFRRLVEAQPFLLHEHGDPLEDQEGRVALVDVVHGGPDSQFAEQPDPAHAQQDLLLDPRARIGIVEARGDLPVLDSVARHVGIEQVQGNPPHLDFPDVREEGSAGEIERDLDLVAAVVPDDLHRHIGKIVFRVFRDLDSVAVKDLPEESALVQDPNADEGDVEIARGLQVVAGERSQAAGVDGDALVQAVFRGKVRDR